MDLIVVCVSFAPGGRRQDAEGKGKKALAKTESVSLCVCGTPRFSLSQSLAQVKYGGQTLSRAS